MRNIVFLWEDFGPMHIDRCRELALTLAAEAWELGLQWKEKSAIYPWTADASSSLGLPTPFPKARPANLTTWGRFIRTLRACLGSGGRDFLFSHHKDLAVALVASRLALMGRRVFGMALSKFDDHNRKIGWELIKAGFLWPYAGFLTDRGRTTEYLPFLTSGGVPLAFGYNTLSAPAVRRPIGLPHRNLIARPSPGSCRRRTSLCC